MKILRRSTCLFLAVAVFLGSTVSVPAAVDMVLKIQDIAGDSQVAGHVREIDILAFDWAVAKAPKSKSTFQSLNLTKFVDSASPRLLRACASGECLPTVQFKITHASATPQEYFTIVLKNVRVVSVVGGGSSGQDLLTENVSLSFEQVWTSYTQLLSNGTVGETIPFSWDTILDAPVQGGAPAFVVTGFGCAVAYTNGAPTAKLSWNALAGQKFRLMFKSNLAAPFSFYSYQTSAADGSLTIPVPANTAQGFFRVELVQ